MMNTKTTSRVKDLFGKFHFTGISVSILGVDLGFEFSSKKDNGSDQHEFQQEEKIRKYLKELYIIRNSLSHFYFSYYSLKESLSVEYIDEGELEEQSVLEYFGKALETYRDISKTLIASDYFLLLKNEERKKILESFDYIYLLDTLMEYDEDYEVTVDEQHKIIMDLLSLYESIDNTIDKINDLHNQRRP